MADAILVAQYHIQKMKLALGGIHTDLSNIRIKHVRIGHMFNRINTLIWDCLMVCGLKSFIVSRVTAKPTPNHSVIEIQLHFTLSN